MAENTEVSFEEALEAIFEERTQELSSGLRSMLRDLFLEGVKEGRKLERELQFDPRVLKPFLEVPSMPSIIESRSTVMEVRQNPYLLKEEDLTPQLEELVRKLNTGLPPSWKADLTLELQAATTWADDTSATATDVADPAKPGPAR